MRKIGIVLVMLICAFVAQAGEYGYLLFTNTSGITTALTVNNLSATVSGSTLVVTNDDGTVNFTLTELASMQFAESNTVTALENVLDGDKPVQVYSINGASLGTFNSMLQAAQQLGKGSYVMVQSGKSQKWIVK